MNRSIVLLDSENEHEIKSKKPLPAKKPNEKTNILQPKQQQQRKEVVIVNDDDDDDVDLIDLDMTYKPNDSKVNTSTSNTSSLNNNKPKRQYTYEAIEENLQIEYEIEKIRYLSVY